MPRLALRHLPVLAWLAGAALAPLGCSDDGAPPAPTSTPAGAAVTRAAAPTEAEVQRLRRLGYLDTVEAAEPDDPAIRGVVLRDPARSYRGYDLYTERAFAGARLIDAAGTALREWHDPRGRRWSRARLLPDGDVVAVGVLEVGRRGKALPEDRYVVRLDWDGAVLWRSRIPAHHDVEHRPDGRLLTLTMHNRSLPAVHPELDVRDDRIALLSQQGAVVEALSLYDLLASAEPPFAFQRIEPTLDKGDPHLDLIHANSVVVFDQPALAGTTPLHRDEYLLVTLRHQDLVAVVDWEGERVVWTWGPGEVSGPHDAVWLANGNFLIFDNGLGRNWSRVVELDPIARQIVWEYKAPEPERFYTAARGTAQRLPNGNTLITNSGRGQVFEVTPDGDVVWEFWNPSFSPENERWALGRLERYASAFVEPLLRGDRPALPASPEPR